MNTTSLKPGIQKTINNISEIWFLLILAVIALPQRKSVKQLGEAAYFYYLFWFGQ